MSKKQIAAYSEIHDAYSLLSDQGTKTMIDLDLMNSNHRTSSLIDAPSKTTEPEIEEEVELSREKTIGVAKKDNSNILIFAVAVVGVLGWYYLNGSDKPKQEQIQQATTKLEIERKEQEEAKKAEQARLAQQPIPLIAQPDAIENNVLYPSPKAFMDENLRFTQNGELFPTSSGLIASLPQTHQGSSSILIQNPHKSPIYGKLIVQFAESMQPIVIRNFYITASSSLEIFDTPSGKYQIQILTLGKPTAYVSPTFSIPLYSEERVTQFANWAYAYQPSSVF
ncbi:hypothetical protein HLH17_14375 [Acinetobacter sp. ANC 5380]|uniref:Uncharacterized protein n=1 Tax=Acinetobacter terrae TaxID=2731247 RepID=A0A7Y2RHL9_9GAMM|nr:hypothetical protein [Acinetobacter terrae]NNH78807.1 hypothetical protein [Acinetobacter terrae]